MRIWESSRRSIFYRTFVRGFTWLWATDPEKLNICKIFWGTIFFPLAAVFVDNKKFGWGDIIARMGIYLITSLLVLELVWPISWEVIITIQSGGVILIVIAYLIAPRQPKETSNPVAESKLLNALTLFGTVKVKPALSVTAKAAGRVTQPILHPLFLILRFVILALLWLIGSCLRALTFPVRLIFGEWWFEQLLDKTVEGVDFADDLYHSLKEYCPVIRFTD